MFPGSNNLVQLGSRSKPFDSTTGTQLLRGDCLKASKAGSTRLPMPRNIAAERRFNRRWGLIAFAALVIGAGLTWLSFESGWPGLVKRPDARIELASGLAPF